MIAPPETTTATPDWHGWQVPALGAIHVGKLPGRKSVCLYVVERPPGGGSVLRTLAFFRDAETAATALRFLDGLATGRRGVDQ